MTSAIETAKTRLFGEGGLAAADIKISPGSDRDATPEALAGQVVQVLDQLERGDFEVVESFDD